jgi:hypothetical protein
MGSPPFREYVGGRMRLDKRSGDAPFIEDGGVGAVHVAFGAADCFKRISDARPPAPIPGLGFLI